MFSISVFLALLCMHQKSCHKLVLFRQLWCKCTCRWTLMPNQLLPSLSRPGFPISLSLQIPIPPRYPLFSFWMAWHFFKMCQIHIDLIYDFFDVAVDTSVKECDSCRTVVVMYSFSLIAMPPFMPSMCLNSVTMYISFLQYWMLSFVIFVMQRILALYLRCPYSRFYTLECQLLLRELYNQK